MAYQIKEMMKSLRNSGALFAGTEKITDYNKPVKAEFGFDDLVTIDLTMAGFASFLTSSKLSKKSTRRECLLLKWRQNIRAKIKP